jgi:hypothetical protein
MLISWDIARCSEWALSAQHRPKFCSPSMAIVTSPYEWKILEWDVKQYIIDQSSPGVVTTPYCNRKGEMQRTRPWFELGPQNLQSCAPPTELAGLKKSNPADRYTYKFVVTCEVQLVSINDISFRSIWPSSNHVWYEVDGWMLYWWSHFDWTAM